VAVVTVPGPGRTGEPTSLPAAYFDRLYASDPDPWRFAERWYERRKRDITLACLPHERYAAGFEPGCSVGLLTEALAERCDTLLSTDVAAAAVSAARRRVAHLGHVRVEQRAVPGEWPEGAFDLVLVSEVGYYLGPDDLGLLAQRVVTSLTTGGVLVLCHWRHPVDDYPIVGDEVHERMRALTGLHCVARHDEEDFLLEVLAGGPPESVARREGLVQ
jgi:SAM-dependent methyltransferase